MITTRAAVAFEAGQPLSVETVDLAPPAAGEVLVEIKAQGFVTPTLIRFPEPILRMSFRRFWVMRAQVSLGKLAAALRRSSPVTT